MAAPCLLLVVGAPADVAETSPWGPFAIDRCATLDDAAACVRERRYDALLLPARDDADAERIARWPALAQAVLDAAVVVIVPQADVALAQRLLVVGVHDVQPANAPADALARALRLGVERKAIEKATRKALATDLATGLPNHAQLLEHMTHLFALREREPAPMALLAVRVEGLASTEARLGAESANVLRRKVAVRLRSALRASDVVAAVARDTFVVLLAWIDAPGDGERVAAKLARLLQQPFNVAGESTPVAVALGVGIYPDQGRDPDALLRRALGQAASVATIGATAFATAVERRPADAANDEGA
jgi:diguanylate cyclase (GGDEF)-like protein